MKKTFFVLMIFTCASTQILFAAEGKSKGFSFYSKKQTAPEKAEEKVVEAKVAETAVDVEKVAEKVVEAVPEKAMEVAADITTEEALKMVEASKVHRTQAQQAPAVPAAPIAPANPEQEAHLKNLNTLKQRLANNNSITDVQKTDLAEVMISVVGKGVDLSASTLEKTVLFFEATGNDPNMSVEEKKAALKKGPSSPSKEGESVAVTEAPKAPAKEVAAKEAPKAEPKKRKFF